MPISAGAAAVIRCSAHQGRSERCVPINACMPANLRALFRLDYEAQCQDLCKRWDFVSRLHAHLVDGLLLANSGAAAGGGLLTLCDADLQTEETEQRAEQAEELRLRRGRCEELIKLRTETQMAEVKLAEYMRMYAAQRAATAAASSSNLQQPQQRWARHNSASSSASAQMKTPAPARMAAHPYKPTHRSANTPHMQPQQLRGAGHRRLTAFTGDSGVASATSVGHQLQTSTPLPEPTSPSETSMGYTNFRRTLKAQGVAAISRPTVLKSILKKSSAGGSSTRSGGSRASGGSATGLSSVPSSAGLFMVYEQEKTQQQQQQRPQRSGNPSSMMAAPASHEQRSRDTP